MVGPDFEHDKRRREEVLSETEWEDQAEKNGRGADEETLDILLL
jgi:hypothetical protein